MVLSCQLVEVAFRKNAMLQDISADGQAVLWLLSLLLKSARLERRDIKEPRRNEDRTCACSIQKVKAGVRARVWPLHIVPPESTGHVEL